MIRNLSKWHPALLVIDEYRYTLFGNGGSFTEVRQLMSDDGTFEVPELVGEKLHTTDSKGRWVRAIKVVDITALRKDDSGQRALLKYSNADGRHRVMVVDCYPGRTDGGDSTFSHQRLDPLSLPSLEVVAYSFGMNASELFDILQRYAPN